MGKSGYFSPGRTNFGNYRRGFPPGYDAANQALIGRRGKCVVFASITGVMLTRAGIPNMDILRVGGITNHRWNLFNPDDLGWFHLDTGPNGGLDFFMFTSSQAREFSVIRRQTGLTNYFTYDPTLYPEIM